MESALRQKSLPRPAPVRMSSTSPAPAAANSVVYRALSHPGTAPLTPDVVRALQTSHGNAFVQRLVAQSSPAHPRPLIQPGQRETRHIARAITIKDVRDKEESGEKEEVSKEKEEKPESVTGDVNKIVGLLMSKGKMSIDDFTDGIWELLGQFNKQNKVFDTLDDLYGTLMNSVLDKDKDEKNDSEDALSDDEEFYSQYKKEINPFGNLNLWAEDEDPKQTMKNTNFTSQFTIGEPERKGMDYKTVDKEAYTVQGKPKLILLIRMSRPPGAGTVWNEFQSLRTLGKMGAKVISAGHCIIKGIAYPTLLMKRYYISSKAIVRRIKGEVVLTGGYKQALKETFTTLKECQNGIQSLEIISSELGKGELRYGIDDIQFLIKNNGKFVINDVVLPKYSKDKTDHLEKNHEIINALKIEIKERAQGL